MATADLLRDMPRRIQAVDVKPDVSLFELGQLIGPRRDPTRADRLPTALPALYRHNLERRRRPARPCSSCATTCRPALTETGSRSTHADAQYWLTRGVPASNGTLTMRAREILERLGARVLMPNKARRLASIDDFCQHFLAYDHDGKDLDGLARCRPPVCRQAASMLWWWDRVLPGCSPSMNCADWGDRSWFSTAGCLAAE
jgi:hypothetical protein